MVISSVGVPRVYHRPPQPQQAPGDDDEFPEEGQNRLRLATLGGAVVGSAALGIGTSFLNGPTETLIGFAQGSVAGAAVGAAAGAFLATWLLSDPNTQGRIGLAVVGGALGGVTGLMLGGFGGAYLGNAAGNAVGYVAGAALGAGAGYIAARLTYRGEQ